MGPGEEGRQQLLRKSGKTPTGSRTFGRSQPPYHHTHIHSVHYMLGDMTMKPKRILLAAGLAITLSLMLVACKKESSTSTPSVTPDVNTPVTASALNAFTYTIHASQFSQGVTQPLTFTSDSLVITLTASNYGGGQALIQVLDSLGVTLFADTVSSNKIVALTHLKATIPTSCTITLTNLSAWLTFVMAAED
jgi:hypothetical protein